MNTQETQAHILTELGYDGATKSPPVPGPLRWRELSPGISVLQQQWRDPQTGKRIWVNVPTDTEG